MWLSFGFKMPFSKLDPLTTSDMWIHEPVGGATIRKGYVMADNPFYDTPHGKITQLERKLAEAGFDVELIDAINKKRGLAKAWVGDLRQRLSPPRATLSGDLVFDRFTPVNQYADRILARSKLRGWGFDGERGDPTMRLAMNRVDLREHAGPLEPTGVMLWLGRDLAYNWAEALAWLKDELEAANLDLTWYNYLENAAIAFYEGSEQEGNPNAGLVGLDFHTFWDRQNGVVPREVRPKRPNWPGLEVVWFLALNPQYCARMDGGTIPFLTAPGLVADSELPPGRARVLCRCPRGWQQVAQHR